MESVSGRVPVTRVRSARDITGHGALQCEVSGSTPSSQGHPVLVAGGDRPRRPWRAGHLCGG